MSGATSLKALRKKSLAVCQKKCWQWAFLIEKSLCARVVAFLYIIYGFCTKICLSYLPCCPVKVPHKFASPFEFVGPFATNESVHAPFVLI